MKKYILFLLCFSFAATACTHTSDEDQYVVDNRLPEDIEVMYVCRNFQDGDLQQPDGNAIIIDTVFAHQSKHLLYAEQRSMGGPYYAFPSFTVRDMNQDTILSWTSQDNMEEVNSAWKLEEEVEDKSRYHRHFIHKFVLIIDE